MKMNKKQLKMLIRVELARRNFYEYCRLRMPEFYKKDRLYLKELCNTFQAFYEGEDDDILIINMPPRFGKSLTSQLFTEWVLGINNQEKIITASYNETLSSDFSKNVRNNIQELKADLDKIVYGDIFSTKIKRGDGAMKLWSVEGAYKSYLATSPSGTVTGFGASLMIIDDIIKNAEEALNENVLEKHWNWFRDTMNSRIEQGGKLIVIFTRWSLNDLVGRLIEHCKKEHKNYVHVEMRAEQDNGNVLCESILSKKRCDELKRLLSEEIFEANYNQRPISIKGRLYTRHNTYKDLFVRDLNNNIIKDKRNKPVKMKFERIFGYIDTADTGEDYLTFIVAGLHKNRIYIIDILYTQEPMEITEKLVADMICKHNVSELRIESNNGGRGFARNVADILEKEYKNFYTQITTFTQTKNKISRILSQSTNVMNNIYFPECWSEIYEDAFNSFVNYQRIGKNKHDDFEDALTGIWETYELWYA